MTATVSGGRQPPGVALEPGGLRPPLTISFVIDSLSRAGTETQLLALIRTLDRTRFHPTLVLLNGNDDQSRTLLPTDIPTLRLGVSKLLSRHAWRASKELRTFWREHRPDIVQAYFLDSAYFALPLAKWMNIPHRLRVRNNLGYWLTPRHRVFERLVKPFTTGILTNSDAARSALNHRRITVIGNGVDIERFTPQARALNVACVANLRSVKNIDGLMRAAAKVPAVRFTVAGEGPEQAALEALRDQLGLHDRFHLPGSIRDIPKFLGEHAIAVLPSHSEGMSNALLEAMAAGCAVVATDVGENVKVLGDAGVIVPVNDDAIATAIQNLVNDPQRVKRLGQRARQRVEAEYSRDAMRRNFETYYSRLMTHRSRLSRLP